MSTQGTWKCLYCSEALAVGPKDARAPIEAHLATHRPLKACLGAADACKNQTNAFESTTPGYCIDCASDPNWKKVTF